jgi:hypothetical protein
LCTDCSDAAVSTASNTAAAAAADVLDSGCTAGGARVGAGVKVGRVGSESDGSLRSGMDIETVGKEETDADMRLKKDAFGAGAGAAGSDIGSGQEKLREREEAGLKLGCSEVVAEDCAYK